MRWRRLPRRLLTLTNIALALLLGASYLALWVNPAHFWLPSLLALGAPLLIIANLLFLILWIIFRRRAVWIPLIALLLGIPFMGRFVQLRTHSTADNQSGTLNILTYNVNLFRLYSWSAKPPTPHDVANLCSQLQADIVCLQEFLTLDTGFTDSMARALFGGHARIHYIMQLKSRSYGLALFSHHPIVASGTILFPDTFNGAMYCDIDLGHDTVRIYNIHLQSFRLGPRDLAFLRNPRITPERSSLRRIRSIAQRIRKALALRGQQTDTLQSHIARSPYPVIVCGDFNDSPISYAYQRLRGNLLDAFCEAGSGFGSTYRNLFPAYRIDYTFHTPSLKLLRCTAPSVPYSDHYPVLTTFLYDSLQHH